MSKYSLYDDFEELDAADEEIRYFDSVPRNDLGCAPVEDYCAEHDDMLVTPERCVSGVFSTWVDSDEVRLQ